ncbi:DegV family protein [Fusibacter sp. JL298sf-3]
MGITLITDSTCDLLPKDLEKRGIRFASLKVLFGEEEFIDKVSLTNEAFYDRMRQAQALPTTSQVNPNEFVELFQEELDKGNQIIGLFISSELSGTYNAASIAKLMLESDDIHLVDSRTTSFGLALLVHKAQDLIDEGLEIKEVVEAIKPYIENSQLYGMLDNLTNLKKGGRLPSSHAVIGNLLNLKPIIEVKEGVVEVANKARGAKKGMQWMIDKLLETFPNGKIDTLGVAYANDLEKLRQFKTFLMSKIQVENFVEVQIGTVVGTHTGEGAVGIAYFKNHS